MMPLDQFAIALYFKEIKVGYIPKEKNQLIARLMDAGKAFMLLYKPKNGKATGLGLM